MENIQGYGSDSDSSQGPENEPQGNNLSDFSSSESEAFSHLVTRPQKLTSHSASSDKLESHNNIKDADFFGLDAVDKVKVKQNRYSFNTIHEDGNKDRKVSTRFGEVEVPVGDFWADFIPDSNDDACPPQTSHSEYYKRQTEEASVVRESSPHEDHGIRSDMALIPHQNSLKRPHWDNNSENGISFTGHGKRVQISSQGTQQCKDLINYTSSASYTQVQNTKVCHSDRGMVTKHHHDTTTQEKRKLYYIHSKVAPYLNSNSVNKCASKCLNAWSVHDGVVNRIAWNVPNYSHLLLTAGMDASVRVWNVWSSLDLCVATLTSHKKAVKHAEWCHAGRKILSCSYDRAAHITDVEAGKVTGECEHAGFVSAGCVHPSNPNLFASGTDNMILMWDMRTPQAPVKYFSYKDKFGQVLDLLFIRDNQELVSCSDLVSRDSADRSIMAWDVRSRVVLSNQIFQERYTCSRLKLHPSGSHFMAQTQGGYVALFSTSSPYKMDKSKRYEGHKMQGYSIGFDISPDGSLVYSGSAESGVHCYDQRSGRGIRKLSSGSNVITDVACHPVLTSLIASSTWGGSISLWQ